MLWRECRFGFINPFSLLFFLFESLFCLAILFLLSYLRLVWRRERVWHGPFLESLVNKLTVRPNLEVNPRLR